MQKNNRIKIAFFVPSLMGGGAERAIINLANEFGQKNNIQADLILAIKKGPYLSEIKKEINVVDLNSSNIPLSGSCQCIDCFSKSVGKVKNQDYHQDGQHFFRGLEKSQFF